MKKHVCLLISLMVSCCLTHSCNALFGLLSTAAYYTVVGTNSIPTYMLKASINAASKFQQSFEEGCCKRNRGERADGKINTIANSPSTLQQTFSPAQQIGDTTIPSCTTEAHEGGKSAPSQQIPIVDIPQVIRNTISLVPHQPERPIFINLNVSNQQAAANSSGNAPCTTTTPKVPLSSLSPGLQKQKKCYSF